MASPLSRDPEHLKIPAFMRKREISVRSRKKSPELTALDRKEAGYLPVGVTKKTAKTSQLYDGQREAPRSRRAPEFPNVFDKNSLRQAQAEASGVTNKRNAWRNQNLYDSVPTVTQKERLSTTSTSEHAMSRRPGNMWEIAIANIHKEKHPEARVVPALKPRVRRKPVQEQAEATAQTFAAPTQHQQFSAPDLFSVPQEQYTQPTQQPYQQLPPQYQQQLEQIQHPQPQFQQTFDPTSQSYYRPDRPTRLSHDLQHRPTQQGPSTQALIAIGEITQFYGKINVAVLRLDDELSVGDSITYQTPDGSHTQTVLSMEIDRKPIFKATPGDEVGIKLYKQALVGKIVYAQKEQQ